ncbi:MAG: hypothetical protein JW720_14075 [Sedimentisphaerales bacterium]|nr:hypothetical protein [Sedimentisphaerales bacterium]
MNRNTKRRSRQSGSALALVLIVTVLLMVFGMGMLRCGLQARVYAARTASEISAQVAADAGLQIAIAEMNHRLANRDTETAVAFDWSEDVLLPNSDATYSYKITANSLEAAIRTGTTIVSVGRCGQFEKTVNANVEITGGPFEYAVFTTQSGLNLKPGTVVDSFNSDTDGDTAGIPLQLGTNSTETAAITIGPGAVVNGDVVVGYSGDPDSVISASLATITGDTFAMSEEREVPSVEVPASIRLLPTQPTITAPTVITKSGKYEAVTLSKGELTIDGPVTMYVVGAINLGKSATIQINEKNPNASLTLYLGGNFTTKNGAMINNFTEDPKRLQIYGLDTCSLVAFATGGVFYGAVYAPNASIVVKSALEIYGAIVGDSFTQGATSNFHYDVSLLEDQAPDFWSSGFEITRWWEGDAVAVSLPDAAQSLPDAAQSLPDTAAEAATKTLPVSLPPQAR